MFGSDRRTETAMAADLASAMRPGMIVLADRNYGYAPTIIVRGPSRRYTIEINTIAADGP
ncbi:MAG TPA: hypothetical protein VF328_15915 [Mycobacterium sp.]